MPIPPTGDQYLDGLALAAAGVHGAQPPGDPALGWALHQLMEVAQGARGLIVSNAVVPIAGTTIRYVSPEVLNWLDYPNQQAYADALTDARFIRADYVDVVNSHVIHASAAPYDARLARGLVPGQVEAPAYRAVRLQGVTILRGIVAYRFTAVWLAA